MRRREVTLLATILLMEASIAHAQPAERVWRLGFISSGYSTSSSLRLIPAELAGMGYVEGRNLILKSRFAEGAPERLPILAREMAGRRLDAIIAVSNPAIRAVKEAAPTTPIVMAFAGEDPVAAGLVSSLNRPGGTVTGVAVPATEMDAKRIELVAQAMPDIKRIALLTTRYAEQDRTLLARSAAQALGLDLIIVTAANKLDYDAAFKVIASANVTALVIGSSPVFFRDVTELTARALQRCSFLPFASGEIWRKRAVSFHSDQTAIRCTGGWRPMSHEFSEESSRATFPWSSQMCSNL